MGRIGWPVDHKDGDYHEAFSSYFAGTIDGIAMVLKFFGISCLRVNGVWRVGLMD